MSQRTTSPYVGAATGIGSMPGTDAAEAARVVFGELPDLPHLAELPQRGVGADMIGRAAALLVDLPVEVVPSGYRVASRPGVDHRLAVDLLLRDLDAAQDAADAAGGTRRAVKVQVPGPWTLCASVELGTGHRVLSDAGAVREFTASLLEGLAAHVTEVGERTGLPVAVQFDEPSLPAVLRGSIPTPSGFGTVAAVPEPQVRDQLADAITAVETASGHPVAVHCCARRPPLALLREAGAGALSVDVTQDLPTAALDEIGEAWEAGTTLLLGLVPTDAPARTPELHDVALPALRLVDRLGFPRTVLAERAAPTPVCGLASATPDWARTALGLTRDLAQAFAQPLEMW
jgi:hypothetical protein